MKGGRTVERSGGHRFLCAALMLAALPPCRPAALLAQEHAGHHMEPGAAAMTSMPLGIPMSRDGSGTAWLPDSSPVYAIHRAAGAWSLMFHGNAFLQYIADGGDRGSSQFGSVNWLMGMARRPAAGGFVALRAMLSSEAATVGRCGYPDILATGERCRGQPLHDRQHPHDFFMELAVSYDRALSRGLAMQLYVAPAGEPALGPVAYPHRISALPNPIAPIGHHWLDATHISFGVVTAAIYGRRWKLEGSVFNGREPDDDRYTIDLAGLDSYAARLWILPGPHWAFQVSLGRLHDAEPAIGAAPAASVTRATASVTHQRALGADGSWATTLMWGRNEDGTRATSAVLAETNLSFSGTNLVFATAESARKTGAELALGVAALDDRAFTIGKLAIGYEHRLARAGALGLGIGTRMSASFLPADLVPYYGTRMPLGAAVFMALRPVRSE